MASAPFEKLSINLEKSLLEDYRKFILSLNSSSQNFVQHPQYSFYYSEFCQKNDQLYNKKCLESKEEKKFDEIAKRFFQRTEAANLVSKVSNLVRESVCKEEADMGKIIGAFVIMETYVKNLILTPWKKEFHVILTYSGMFKVWIEPHLLGIEPMFNQFGYRSTAEGDKFILAEELPKANLEMTAMVFRLASLLCLILCSAKRCLPQVPLERIFEVAQKTPVSEEELIMKYESGQKKPHQPSTRLDPIVGRSDGKVANVRDTGTQCDFSPADDKDFDVKSPSMAVRRKSSHDVKNYSDMAWGGSASEDRSVPSRGIKTRDVDVSLRGILTRHQNYGFSQLPGKGLPMCMTPESEDEEEEEEEGEELEKSVLFRVTRERMKAEGDSTKKMTFSTFKKEQQSMDRCKVQGVYEYDDGDEDKAASIQSKSESSLEKIIKSHMSKRNK